MKLNKIHLSETISNQETPQGFREKLKLPAILPTPGKVCPRCVAQTLLSVRNSYNCSSCGWQGRNPLQA